jgi:type II secretory pathway component PulF
MRFIFKAKDQKGELRKGEVEALGKESAIQILQKNNLVPIFITEEKKSVQFVEEIKRIWEGVKPKELVIFFRELSTLLDAKITVVPALRAIEKQTENRYLKMVIRQIADDVEDGMPLSESIAKHPNTFSSLAVNMIKAGEISGSLQKSIKYMADNTEKNYQLTSKVKSAVYYPTFVLIVAGIIGFLTITIILPKLTQVIRDMGVQVPWYTKAIMTVGDFMQSYWWVVIVLIFGAIAGFFYYIKTESGKKEWDQIKINIPIFGKVFRYIYITRFANNLSVLLNGGVPIVRAMTIVGSVVNNSVYQKVIFRAADVAKSGGSINSVFYNSVIMPSIVSEMIKIGEETGKLSDILINVADFYDQEADHVVRNISSLIEPVLIVILGIGVAIMVFSILMPIYNVVGQM